MAAGSYTPTKSRYTASTATRMNPPPRPSSIPELATRAFTNLWDPSKDFKHWLRVAERCRNTGKDYIMMGDLENAFVEYAKAATLILDRMPTHSEYLTRLNPSQRDSLTAHGQELLKNLGQLKPTLTQRYQAWQASQASASDPSDTRSGGREHALADVLRTEAEVDARAAHEARTRERRVVDDTSYSQTEQTPNDWTVWYPPETRERSVYDTNAVPKQKSQADLRADERSRHEQLGIVQRQNQAEAEARAARASVIYSRPPPVITRTPSTVEDGSSDLENLPILPLESPKRYDGDSSTDAESADENTMYRRLARMHMRDSQDLSPSKPTFGIISPPPVTTTSPAPPSFQAIHYPELMSQHQRTQGYAPSLQSMFQKPTINAAPSSLLLRHERPSSLYSNIMPTPSQPVNTPSYRNGHLETPNGESSRTHPPWPEAQPHPPPIPPPAVPTPAPAISPREVASRSSITPARKDPVLKELRKVDVPRETLPRFLAIAALNTARNRETCGLMLGRAKGHKFIVTTLLIPRQHSTSDTCAMDEEELVLEFTEQRSLITLGWIHTHPSQSCFMSSVDLHTHSGFQRMLAESFAIVCAPKSTPNFGVFRLTDPPGLHTILSCKAKEAFHPHPDVPIYTDADKGHVQMKDMPLEIVDLR